MGKVVQKNLPKVFMSYHLISYPELSHMVWEESVGMTLCAWKVFITDAVILPNQDIC